MGPWRRRASGPRHAVPRQRPGAAPGRPPAAGSGRTLDMADSRCAGLLHVGRTSREPKGAPAHRRRSPGGPGHGSTPGGHRDDRAALVFLLHPHRRVSRGCSPARMFGNRADPRPTPFDPDGTPEVLSARGVTWPGGNVPPGVPGLPTFKHPATCVPHVGPSRGGPQAAVVGRGAASRCDPPVLAGYGLTEAPIPTRWPTCRTATTSLAVTEGKPMTGVELRIHPPRMAHRAAGEGGDRSSPADDAGYLRPPARHRGPSTPTASSAPATGADSTTGEPDHLGRLKGRDDHPERRTSAEVGDLLIRHRRWPLAVIGVPDSAGRVCGGRHGSPS